MFSPNGTPFAQRFLAGEEDAGKESPLAQTDSEPLAAHRDQMLLLLRSSQQDPRRWGQQLRRRGMSCSAAGDRTAPG